MKYSLLLILVFLTGCVSGVHEDVNENLAEDSFQSIDIITNAIENDTVIDEMEDQDVRVLYGFREKYLDNEYNFETYSETDEDIITFMLGSIGKYANSMLVESDKNELLGNFESVEEMIKTGRPYLELND